MLIIGFYGPKTPKQFKNHKLPTLDHKQYNIKVNPTWKHEIPIHALKCVPISYYQSKSVTRCVTHNFSRTVNGIQNYSKFENCVVLLKSYVGNVYLFIHKYLNFLALYLLYSKSARTGPNYITFSHRPWVMGLSNFVHKI